MHWETMRPSEEEIQNRKGVVNREARWINSLGKSTIDGDRGRNDPGDINAGKSLRNDFSNLHCQKEYQDVYIIQSSQFCRKLILMLELVWRHRWASSRSIWNSMQAVKNKDLLYGSMQGVNTQTCSSTIKKIKQCYTK